MHYPTIYPFKGHRLVLCPVPQHPGTGCACGPERAAGLTPKLFMALPKKTGVRSPPVHAVQVQGRGQLLQQLHLLLHTPEHRRHAQHGESDEPTTSISRRVHCIHSKSPRQRADSTPGNLISSICPESGRCSSKGAYALTREGTLLEGASGLVEPQNPTPGCAGAHLPWPAPASRQG